MARDRIGGAGFGRPLQAQFDVEVRELLLTATPYGDVEAIMRMRAMAEISSILSTSELLELTLKLVEDRGGATAP